MFSILQKPSRRWGVAPHGVARATGLALIVAAMTPFESYAQWSTTYEQFYLQAKHNWQFRHRHQAADRLFNAFDFGHAILYETLWSKPNAPPSELEEKWYNRLTKEILVHPPRVPLEEGAIEIAYARLAPEAKAMFDWAHILHRQIYDVWADERLAPAQKDAEVARLVAYYKTRGDLAFSSKPKSMVLMQEQPYSLAFRQNYPKFNALIWAYHWLQVGLYEPLLVNTTSDARQAGVRATVARFWQMLRDPPRTMPYVMPMTAAVAPAFATRYPEAAAIFDNLHSMHDVVSDILANPSVPRDRKRDELMLAARRFRDDTSHVMTVEAWRTMAQHMGVENMGGPATNFLPELPTPTVTYGAVMTHNDRTGEMTGFKYGEATGGAHAAMQHAAGAKDSTKAGQADHAAMGHAMAKDTAGGKQGPDAQAAYRAVDTSRTATQAHMQQMMELHMRLMADSVIRRRMLADTATRRMMMEMIDQMPPEHREHMQQLIREVPREAAKAPNERPRARSTPRRQPAKPAAKPAAKPPAKPAAKPADPHAGHRPPR
jgi:hypothetical protein